MRQGNGTDLLGMNDPRSATIGVIYVSPNDDRTSVFAALLTQDKLNREQIVIVLPDDNTAFERSQDFDDLKTVDKKLKGDLIFIAPNGSAAAENARQRRFTVFPSLEVYTESLRQEGGGVAGPVPAKPAPERRGRIFGGRKSAALGGAAGAAAGAALGGAAARDYAASHPDEDLDAPSGPSTRSTPGRRVPPAAQVPPSDPDTPLPARTQGPTSVPYTPDRGTLDDDDALDEPTSSPGRRGGPNSSRGGYVPSRYNQRGRSAPLAGVSPVDDDDDWEPGPSAAAAGGFAGAAAAAARNAGTPSTPLAGHPNADAAESSAAGPDIIDLQPVSPRGGPVRSTLKLGEGPAFHAGGAPAADATSTPTRKRRTGSMATAAAGGALVGAAAAGGAGAAQGRPVAGALPPRGSVPSRVQRNTSRRRSGWVLLLMLLVLLLLSLVGGTVIFAYVNPTAFHQVISPVSHVLPGAGAPPATVSITPDSKTVSNNFIIQAVTQNPNPKNLQVSMRNVAANPPAQTKNIAGTGKANIPATEASGTITFFNSEFTPITIASGTRFTVNGVRIVTDAPANLPAFNPPTAGQATVRAHAITPGAAGNIAYRALTYGSVSGRNVTAQNEAAFTGGQDAQAYTFVQQSDVNAAVGPVVNSLSQQARSTFNQQLRINERLAGDPVCNHTTNVPLDQVGQQGKNISSVTVTVSASCTGIVYDYQGAQALTQQRLQAQASRDLGPDYKLVGTVVPTVKQVTPAGQNVILQTTAQGVWAFQMSDSQQQALKRQLAGKKIADARAILGQIQGIKSSIIKLDNGNTLPTDPTQITLSIQSVSGLSSGTGNGGSGGNSTTPAVNSPVTTPTPETGRGIITPSSQDQSEKSVKG